ncbi:MAG: FIST signal transduction protein [Solirubrobacteraceae bacterium]
MTDVTAGAGSGTGPGAAGDAVRLAVADLDGPARLVMLFPSEDVEPRRAAAEAVAAAPGAAVAGMTCSGSLPAVDPPDSAHCAAIALGGAASVGIGVAEQASRDLRAAGHEAAADALREAGDGPGQPLLLLFVDAGAGDQSDAVAGAYEATGPAVPFAGGGAPVRHGAQFGPDGAGSDRVVAVLLRWPGPVGVGMAHSCHTRRAPAIVTRADGRTVAELDGRPAADVYLEALGVTGARLSDTEFEELAVLHPLGQPELRGDVRLRHVLGRTAEGGLACATTIPANAAVVFGEQTPTGIVASVGDATREALEPLRGAPVRAALAFDCAGRKRAVGELLQREMAAIVEGIGAGVPLAGGFTSGEIGRHRGAKGDRNHALVVVALG